MEVLGSTGDGARVSIRWHYLPDHPAYHEEVRVHAEGGSLALRFPTPYVLHAPTELIVTSQRGSGEEVTRFTAFDEAFERQLRAFHAMVVSGETPLAGIAEGRADIITCQQIIRRLAEARGVPVAGEAQRA
jgi:predicted dehydrogenase